MLFYSVNFFNRKNVVYHLLKLIYRINVRLPECLQRYLKLVNFILEKRLSNSVFYFFKSFINLSISFKISVWEIVRLFRASLGVPLCVLCVKLCVLAVKKSVKSVLLLICVNLFNLCYLCAKTSFPVISLWSMLSHFVFGCLM